MKWETNYKHPEGRTFIIDHDKLAGYYIYIYDNKGKNTHDYLQDTLEIAKRFTYKMFGVPIDSWIKIEG